MRSCAVDACPRPVYAKGFCQAHYKRWRRTGDALPDIDIGATRQRRTCSVDGCDLPVDSDGLCHGHDQRRRRTGDTQPEVPLGRRRQPETCIVEGCTNRPKVKGLCPTHYSRARKNGEKGLDAPIRVVTGLGWLSHGYWYVPVPPEDRWLTNGDDQIAEHRLVMARALGRPLGRDESVHHRNGNRTDNRIENLELWSRYQPSGQRIEDKVAWALQVLATHAPHLLAAAQGNDAAPCEGSG